MHPSWTKIAAEPFKQNTVAGNVLSPFAMTWTTVSVAGDKPRMVLDHSLRNTGKRAIQCSVYDHNFLYLDRRPPGPDVSLTVPFKIRTSQPAVGSLSEIRENRITFSKTLPGEDRVYLNL